MQKLHTLFVRSPRTLSCLIETAAEDVEDTNQSVCLQLKGRSLLEVMVGVVAGEHAKISFLQQDICLRRCMCACVCFRVRF